MKLSVSDFKKRIEFAFHICMLLLLMNAVEPLWREMSGFPYDPVEGDSLQRGILLAFYLLAIPTILIYYKHALRVASRSTLLWLLILWAALSLLWSGSPDITLRRVIAVLLTTLYALVLYLRYPFQSFLRLLGWAYFIAILSSLVMVVAKPDWGIMSSVHEGAWRGIFIHKNSLGKVSVFAICIFATIWSFSEETRQRIFWAGAFVLGAIALIGSHSVTGLVVVATMVPGTMLLQGARLWRKAWVVFLLIILLFGSAVVLLAIQNSEILFDTLGREISLTGRVPLWQVLFPMGLEHPLGYGFGAFWLGWNGPSAKVWSTLGWFLPNAHNGFLQLWLELGWLGLGLGIILLGRIFTVNLGPALAGSKAAVFWMLFINIIITYNLVEINFFDQNNIYWVLIVYAYLSAVAINRGQVRVSLATAQPRKGYM